MNTREKKPASYSAYLNKEVIKESSFKKFLLYFKVVLNSLKSIVYCLALAAMYVQYSSGADDEKLAKALLGFLLVLAAIEIIYTSISVFEEEYKRTLKSIIYLVLLVSFSFIGYIWLENYFE